MARLSRFTDKEVTALFFAMKWYEGLSASRDPMIAALIKEIVQEHRERQEDQEDERRQMMG